MGFNDAQLDCWKDDAKSVATIFERRRIGAQSVGKSLKQRSWRDDLNFLRNGLAELLSWHLALGQLVRDAADPAYEIAEFIEG